MICIKTLWWLNRNIGQSLTTQQHAKCKGGVKWGWGWSGNGGGVHHTKHSTEYISRIITLWQRQDGRHFCRQHIICLFLNENFCISNKISLKYVLYGLMNNKPSLVQIMDCRQTGDKPLSEPMTVEFTDTYMHDSTSMSYAHGSCFVITLGCS